MPSSLRVGPLGAPLAPPPLLIRARQPARPQRALPTPGTPRQNWQCLLMDFVVICHENKASPECELRYFNTSIESCGAAEFTVPRSEQPTCHHSIPVLPPCAANVIFCHLEFCKQNFILWHVACTENTIFQLSKVCTINYIYSTRTKYNV